MTFQSPQWLALLVLVPLLAGLYAARVRRRAAGQAAGGTRPLAEPHLLPGLVPRPPGWRQHVPAAALGLAATAGLVAFAGPTATVADRRDAAALVVAIDVSQSMAESDVAPNRLAAARQAADEFIAALPEHVEVGVVSFAGSAGVLVPPTDDHAQARSALQGLDLRPATAIGEAVFSSVEALAGVGPVDGGPAVPRRVVLLSDGANTAGRPVQDAAAAASAAGVPVDTIAFGTDSGPLADGQPSIDREALGALAQSTGGRAYEAASAGELRAAYERIGSETVVAQASRPVADWLLGLALLAGLGAAAAALPWFRRLPV